MNRLGTLDAALRLARGRAAEIRAVEPEDVERVRTFDRRLAGVFGVD